MTTNETPGKPADAKSFSPGQVLGENLTLKQKLSTEDFGISWLAHDSDTDKAVTLLFLPAVLLQDARVMEELRAQVKLNRQLIHPHVLRTHDFIEEEGWAAISSDAVEGETLAALLAKKDNGCFNPSEIQPWASALCQTLDDAHRAGLLHRDLVPRNVVLAKDSGILIANFGISRIILDALGRILGRGKIDEHLASMSPQQLDGEYPARWDDIYSLGALLYQLLTGKPPFYSGDILPQIRKTAPPAIAGRRSELKVSGDPVPEAWEKVIAACLDKHTPPRPKSAREVGVKLGGDLGIVQPVQPVVRPAEPTPAAEKPEPEKPATDQPSSEIKKSVKKSVDEPPKAEIAAAAALTPVPEVEKKPEPAESKPAAESKESPADDTVRKKPSQQAQSAPGESPSFKHLLEKIPDGRGQESKRHGLKVAGVMACVAALIIACLGGLVWIVYLSTRSNPQQTKATPSTTPTPAAVAKPTPQVTNVAASPSPATASPTAAPDNSGIEQMRKELEQMRNALADKTKARQQAEADHVSAKSALDAENTVLDGMKKTAADNENLRKQRDDEATKAAADATKAADDLKAAQKIADDKAAALTTATKVKDEIANQIKDLQTKQQAESTKLDALQKAETDKQAAADSAGNSEKDAKTQLDAREDALRKAETAQLNSTPAPLASGTSTPAPTPDPYMPITSSTATSGSIEAREQVVVQNIESHQPPTAVTPAPAATPSVPSTYISNPNSQVDHTLTNSLGMKFQPVGDVLFSIWLTRVQDFEEFAKDTRFKPTTWLEPGFKQGPDHPVVYVTWSDAMAFCKWLTDKEHKSGMLAANQSYRLPTDLEWSKAVGLPEENGKTPDERDVGVKDVYPWGSQWPPPQGAGNYDGEETDSEVSIKGYNDGFVYTSPVGSFAANKYGLYDMGGNAWEWCMDWYNGEQKQKVLRGASWYNGDLQLSLLSSCRWPSPPDKSSDNFSFRVVIVTESRTKK